MKTAIFTAATIATLALTLPLFADTSEWKELSGLAFKSIDRDENGVVTADEFSAFGGDVFFSMDTNASGALSLGEFYNWGFGMHNAAENVGQSDAFGTAMRVVFALWDRNADNQVSADEYRQSLGYELTRADLDKDNSLTEAEYLAGFSVVVAAHAAIHPQSIDN
jgi:hypothetical protein